MILKDKAQRWNADREIQSLVKQVNAEDANLSKLTRKYSSGNAKKLLSENLDRNQLASVPLPYEKLDQLTMELLMGVR
jgi:xylose isomerase